MAGPSHVGQRGQEQCLRCSHYVRDAGVFWIR